MTNNPGLLLDTHILLWMAADDGRLSRRVRTAIAAADLRFVSHATCWEVTLKHRKHGSKFAFSLRELEEITKAFGCTELPIEMDDLRELGRLPLMLPDPFDALLVAQAARRAIPLVTYDQCIIHAAGALRSLSILPN